MSVLIRGMEMPKKCLDCPFMISRDNDDCIVQSNEANAKFDSWDDMKASCPLVEIPTPHGRLIDATFEENHYASMLLDPTPDVTEQDKHKARIVIDALRMAKTVIEAEGREE